MKILFTIALSLLTVMLSAENIITFFDFIAEDGSGIEKLLKLQNARADKKRFILLLIQLKTPLNRLLW